MSELKAVHAFDVYEAYTKTGDDEAAQVYTKSEADKVIAELKEKLNNSRNAHKYWRKEYLIEYKESIHHKYKRCLAMAKWCFTKSNYHYILARHGEDVKENNRKSILYSRRHKRWLTLADKYKEGNV